MPKKKGPGDGEGAAILHVISVSSNGGAMMCAHCEATTDCADDLAGVINHYIQRHGYEVLHVGEQTTYAPSGDGLWHSTVAMLGASDPPALRPAPTIVSMKMP